MWVTENESNPVPLRTWSLDDTSVKWNVNISTRNFHLGRCENGDRDQDIRSNRHKRERYGNLHASASTLIEEATVTQESSDIVMKLLDEARLKVRRLRSEIVDPYPVQVKGRKRTARLKSVLEGKRSQQSKHQKSGRKQNACGQCGQMGHNRTTCARHS